MDTETQLFSCGVWRVYKIPVLSPLFFFSLSASAVKFSSSASPTFFSTSSRSSSTREHFFKDKSEISRIFAEIQSSHPVPPPLSSLHPPAPPQQANIFLTIKAKFRGFHGFSRKFPSSLPAPHPLSSLYPLAPPLQVKTNILMRISRIFAQIPSSHPAPPPLSSLHPLAPPLHEGAIATRV